jgi:hypothetical protein
MAGNDTDYEGLAARLTDSEVEAPSHRELHGDEAAAYGRAFLLREFGTEEALEAAMRPGRPKLGTRKPGPSPTVRARVSEEDFAALTRLRKETGRTEAELLREAVHLLLAQHEIAS